ncbi:MAG: DUF6320 domain-containing protein [Spirochaetales bacterium]
MNKCNNCNVDVYESEKRCPLCKKPLKNAGGSSAVEYPDYQILVKIKSARKNIPTFLTIAIILLCVYINIFSHQGGEIIWSAIVSASVLYFTAMIWVIKSKTKRFGSKLLLSYVFLSLLLFIIDATAGMLFWSTNYVVPFLTVGTTLYLTVLAIRNRQFFSEYFGYILGVTAIGIIPIPLYILGLASQAWGVFVALLTCVIIAAGLYLFADKTLKQECKKRFHR